MRRIPSIPAGPLAAILLALGCGGCESDETPPTVGDDEASVAAASPARTVWRTIDDSDQIALLEDAAPADLEEAIAEARRTAESARLRWQAQFHGEARSGPKTGATWAVKWRAPTAGEGHEHVWVEPLSWSPFRIEGRLASPPQRALACGKRRDDLVGFPAEEMVDWVRYDGPDFAGAREGGFTIGVLDGGG